MIKRDSLGKFIKGNQINKGRKKSKEETDRRTKTRRQNGFFKNLIKKRKISKEVYKTISRCPICNCFLSENKKHSCKEVWDKIDTKFKKGQFTGEKHPNYINGASKEKYGEKWTFQLRKEIRKRDNFRCQECFRHEKELKRKLSVHHIDYDKKNNNPQNLICLCGMCHAKTNYTRKKWKNYFVGRRKGKC